MTLDLNKGKPLRPFENYHTHHLIGADNAFNVPLKEGYYTKEIEAECNMKGGINLLHHDIQIIKCPSSNQFINKADCDDCVAEEVSKDEIHNVQHKWISQFRGSSNMIQKYSTKLYSDKIISPNEYFNKKVNNCVQIKSKLETPNRITLDCNPFQTKTNKLDVSSNKHEVIVSKCKEEFKHLIHMRSEKLEILARKFTNNLTKERSSFNDGKRKRRDRLLTFQPNNFQCLEILLSLDDLKIQNKRDEIAKSNITPSFNKSFSDKDFGSSKVYRMSIQVNYDSPDRYLFEFFQCPSYFKFRKEYLKELLNRHIQNRSKVLFLEIEGTLILCSNKKIPNCPILEFVSKDIAFEFDMKEFYIHIRPFAFCFLNTISEKEKVFSPISISNSNEKGVKRISKFRSECITSSNSIIVDCDPKVCALNAHNSIPIHRFKGAAKDSTLLYLEKYLLNLAECEDVTKIIMQDVVNGVKNHIQLPKASTQDKPLPS